MDGIVHRLGLALGGRPGHNLASRLAIPVSKDTLLRTVRRRAARPRDPLRAVGIDDWAWRKGCQYGTVICDLERRRIVALLPDRASGTSAAWLRDHPSIEFIARDRGVSYGDAASKGAPRAIQIADRWHLFENASASFLDVVRQNMHAIRKSSATDDIDPVLLSCAERKRWENFQHRKKTVDAVLRLLEQGIPLKQITRRLSLARQTVRRIARGGGLEVFRSRVSILEPYAETLDALWTGGCRNGAELWRRLRIQGFQGSLRVVVEWATRRRLDESSNPAGRVRKTPSARKIARLMTIERDQVPRDQASMMAKIAHDVQPLLGARDLVDRFHETPTKGRRPRSMDRRRNRQSTQLVCQGHHRGSRRRSSRDHPTMVERSDRRSNHKAQAGEASDVWACKNRSARGTRHRRRVNNCTKSESEPKSDPCTARWIKSLARRSASGPHTMTYSWALIHSLPVEVCAGNRAGSLAGFRLFPHKIHLFPQIDYLAFRQIELRCKSNSIEIKPGFEFSGRQQAADGVDVR